MNINSLNSNAYVNMSEFMNQSNLLDASCQKKSSEINDEVYQSEDAIKFDEIVSKYDIENISQNEINSLYKDLYKNGLITLKDMIVTFDPSKLPGFKEGVSTISGVSFPSNSDEKYNLLDKLTSQAKYNSEYGNKQFQSAFDDRVALAEKIKYFQKIN